MFRMKKLVAFLTALMMLVSYVPFSVAEPGEVHGGSNQNDEITVKSRGGTSNLSATVTLESLDGSLGDLFIVFKADIEHLNIYGNTSIGTYYYYQQLNFTDNTVTVDVSDQKLKKNTPNVIVPDDAPDGDEKIFSGAQNGTFEVYLVKATSNEISWAYNNPERKLNSGASVGDYILGGTSPDFVFTKSPSFNIEFNYSTTASSSSGDYYIYVKAENGDGKSYAALKKIPVSDGKLQNVGVSEFVYDNNNKISYSSQPTIKEVKLIKAQYNAPSINNGILNNADILLNDSIADGNLFSLSSMTNEGASYSISEAPKFTVSFGVAEDISIGGYYLVAELTKGNEKY